MVRKFEIKYRFVVVQHFIYESDTDYKMFNCYRMNRDSTNIRGARFFQIYVHANLNLKEAHSSSIIDFLLNAINEKSI